MPLEGRPIGRTHQGNVFDAFDMEIMEIMIQKVKYRLTLHCTGSNDMKKFLELCLYEGGHEMRVSQIKRAIQEFDRK